MPTFLKSLAERSMRWLRINENAPALAAEMPELREPLDELRTLIQEINILQGQQAHHMAQSRILTARIRALAKRADHLRSRIGASLRGRHGFDSPALIGYGFKPRKWVKQDPADRQLEKERVARAAGEPAAEEGAAPEPE